MAPRRRTVSRSTRATRAAGGTRDDLRFDPFGAEADLLEIRAGALAAGLRHRHRVVAVVAARAVDALVHRQRDAAVRALERRAALAAEDRGREAAAVEQHDRLLAALEARREGVRNVTLRMTSGPSAANSSRMSTM